MTRSVYTRSAQLLNLRWPRPKFLAARLALVVVRPALLIVIANVVGGDEAGRFGRLLVAAGVGMVISAFDSGKAFYRATAGASGRRRLGEFNAYAGRLAIPLLAGLATTAALGFTWEATGWSVLATCTYVVTERVLDERQRYLLVAERIDDWSALQLKRGLLQVACVAMAAGSLRSAPAWAPTWCMLALAASNAASLRLRSAIRRVSRWTTEVRLIDWVVTGGRQLTAHWTEWASGLLAAILGLTDKLIIAAWGDDQAAGQLVAANALSVCAVFVSTFFFTARRGAVVRCELPVRSLMGRGFLVPLAAGMLISVIAAVAAVHALPHDSRPTSMTIVALASLAAVSVSGGIVREICFYRSLGGYYMAIIDAVCLVALVASTFIAKHIGLPLWFAICSGAVVHGLRGVAIAATSTRPVDTHNDPLRLSRPPRMPRG
jgi:hypothetical protein